MKQTGCQKFLDRSCICGFIAYWVGYVRGNMWGFRFLIVKEKGLIWVAKRQEKMDFYCHSWALWMVLWTVIVHQWRDWGYGEERKRGKSRTLYNAVQKLLPMSSSSAGTSSPYKCLPNEGQVRGFRTHLVCV